MSQPILDIHKQYIVVYMEHRRGYNGASDNNIKEPVFAPHGPKYSIIYRYNGVFNDDVEWF